MRSEVYVVTVDFATNYFSAIHIGNQLRLISAAGNIISIPDNSLSTKNQSLEKPINHFANFFNKKND